MKLWQRVKKVLSKLFRAKIQKRKANTYFHEVLFIFGSANIQTFYGPFYSKKDRDDYGNLLKQRENLYYEKYLEQQHIINDRIFGNSINPSHMKHIPREGPLPNGSWKKSIPEVSAEDASVFCWTREGDEEKFSMDILRL